MYVCCEQQSLAAAACLIISVRILHSPNLIQSHIENYQEWFILTQRESSGFAQSIIFAPLLWWLEISLRATVGGDATLGCDTASHVLLQHCSALKGDCKNTNVSCLVYCRSVILRSSQPRLQAWIFFPCLLVQVYPGIRKLSLSCPRWWQSYKTAVAFLGEGLWLKHGPENRAAAVPSLLALPS